jgi:hypothetical protein
MKIGIFSKIEMQGGSEFRCIELANGISQYTSHTPTLLTRGKFCDGLLPHVSSGIQIVRESFKTPDVFYEQDIILVINTDSKEFTKVEYWEKSGIDLSRIKRMGFIFNFIISPAQHLWEFEAKGIDVRILPGNDRFYNELSSKDKHKKVSHLPRMMIESPINPDTVYSHKTPSPKIRIGKHSKSLGDKWNDEHAELIERINKKYSEKVLWDFMGGSSDFINSVKHFKNVILRPEFTLPVNVYLMNLDIFLFYLKWGRQECWARSQAEGLMSGCPSLATDVDGGNRLQIIDGSNGYLCKDINMFYDKLAYLIENPEMIKKLGRNARIYSKFFTTEKIINKIMTFLED